MNHHTEILGTIIFVLAVLHTFSVKLFQEWAHRYPEGSVAENLLHLLGEVETVFGIWSFAFFVLMAATTSLTEAQDYINSRNFTEPLFVFAVMVVASTKPVIDFASRSIGWTAKLLPFSPAIAFYATCLIVGPIFGSFITEPAAMTVTALILRDRFFENKISLPLKYATLGLLFVNVSIGGTLTHFAAPPVVMVASTWNWNTPFMFTHFGWKAIIAIVLATILVISRFRAELGTLKMKSSRGKSSPWAMILIHLILLAQIVATAHHPKLFMSVLLFFLGFATVTREYQEALKIREGLLVGFFLGGLVTLGGVQSWWVSEVIRRLDSHTLYIGASALTAIFDNAALTYLGSLVPDLAEMSKYALVAGSVVGGGLTVIANAPNPIGYGLLNPYFGKDGIDPLQLLRSALIPTLIAGLAFWFL